jgi:hypothetical protein
VFERTKADGTRWIKRTAVWRLVNLRVLPLVPGVRHDALPSDCRAAGWNWARVERWPNGVVAAGANELLQRHDNGEHPAGRRASSSCATYPRA